MSRKGIPNNVGADTKQSIISVFNALGGAEAMLKWASRNQTEFYKILAKILPKDLDILIKENPQFILQQHVPDNPEATPETASRVH